MSTPHNSAAKGDFAPTVLMPGDPLRAKFIAENFLDNIKKINEIRGMYAFTGTYNGKDVSVMGSGMGMPSIGIYSYELFSEYGVETILRVGSCGAYSDKVKVKDVILAQAACTNSNYAAQYSLGGTFAPIADFDTLLKAKNAADKLGVKAVVGNVFSSDVFYEGGEGWKKWAEMGVLAVEMEAAALYMNAAKLKKKALAILTVSDHFVIKGTDTTAEEREKSFTDMMKIALETAVN